jgi:hypothetical protein
MDDTICRRFFLEPVETSHRRYEALRAIFVDGLPLNQVADRFGYRPSALRSLVSRFRSGCRAGSPPPFSFSTDRDVPPAGNSAKTKAVRSSPQSPTVVCGIWQPITRGVLASLASFCSCLYWLAWASNNSSPMLPIPAPE